MMKKSKIYVILEIVMMVLVTIFLNSFYWPYEEVSKRKIVVWSIAFFCVVLVPIIVVKIGFLRGTLESIINAISGSVKKMCVEKRKVILFCSVVFGGVILAWTITYVISQYVFKTGYNQRLLFTLLALGCLGMLTICLWKYAAEKVGLFFVMTALIMGIFCISVTPNRVGISWDDEIHYARALELSNVFNGIMFEAELKNIDDYQTNIYIHNGFSKESDYEYTEQLNSLYDAQEWSAHEFSYYGIWSIAAVAPAIGLILGKGLGLSYVGVFAMGRLFNLLLYILFIALAIRRIKYGKVLLAAIGLIPTTIFMASCYSYDTWVTGLTILGFAYFFAELQEEETLKNKNIAIMIGAITLGCVPKAIYFPILFPLLFMPKRKFKSKRQRSCYYLMILGMGLLLVASFMLPMLVKGPGTGDVRGGSAVNSTEQIKFILNNPLAYAKILIKFLLDYIALGNSGVTLQRYAYVGDGYFYSIISLMLAVLAFLDRGAEEKNYVLVKGANIIGCAVAIVLSTTALYIGFTAVGLNTVAGMQGRYLIPTIFPALYSLGTGGVRHKINKNAFVCVPMLIIALTFIANMFRFCVLHY